MKPMTTWKAGGTIGLRIKTGYTVQDGALLVESRSKHLMVLCGARLEAIFREESKQRPDGLGGVDGAKDTGELTDSIVIISQDYDHVSVGTNLSRARKLAFGERDPTANLDWIMKWATRKGLPEGSEKYRGKQKKNAIFKFSQNVTNKIRKKGPIPNPFHERTKERFMKEYKNIQREALSK